MREHIAVTVYYLGVHLLYASVVCLAAWALTATLRASASVKYWIWIATSLNFLVPLGAILDATFAAHLSWAAPLSLVGPLGTGVAAHAGVIGSLWLAGAVLMSVRLLLRVQAEREVRKPGLRDPGMPPNAAERNADPAPSLTMHGIAVRFTAGGHGPAVKGLWHPHISLPAGIDAVLTEPELDAVLLHELTHARRRDNLMRLVHELTQSLLWFHPLVRIAGSRLELYRELSCDEAVIQRAHGRDLVAALAKLASPESTRLLQAAASSLLRERLARLLAAVPRRPGIAANALLIAMFASVAVAGVFETVAHTACCFITWR